MRYFCATKTRPGGGAWTRLSATLVFSILSFVATPFPVHATEQVYYFHNDHLGTPQSMSDASGRTVWAAEYVPFGKATVNPDPDGNGQIVVNNLRFPGQYFDAETRLHYNYHRDYDPETGRYLQPDPIGLEGGPNLYSYVSSNPVSHIDPTGLIEWTGTVKSLQFFTAGAFQFKLRSECVNRKCANVNVLAVGPGVNFGIDVSGTASTVTFIDLTDHPYPDVFNGEFLYVGAGFSIGLRAFGVSAIQLGGAKSFDAGRAIGIDWSIGGLVGSSTVIEKHFEDCCP